jgi:hypothetical protein
MTKFQSKFTTAIATGAVLLQALAPLAAASTTIQISGNGTESNNTASVDMSKSTTVTQTNSLSIDNNVDVDSDTGNNSADDNTGGDVNVETGDAVTGVKISNSGNTNHALVEDCGCESDTDVLISGNGSDSDNNVDLNNARSTELYQTNAAQIRNNVDVDADTGDNSADDNTGGDVSLRTGDASTMVVLKTQANANVASIGGNGGGGSLSAWITGNGTDSDNDITIDNANDTLLTQANAADVYNRVDVDADTGDNSADDNTGGDVSLETGDADAFVRVDNAVNFNSADLGCGCEMDLLAKISGNGSDSESDIDLTLGGELEAFQNNAADLDNHLKHIDLDTGYNSTDDNTGEVDEASDPSLETGDAVADVRVNNEGNLNTYGSGDSPFEFDFDWNGMMGWFLAHMSL